MKKNRIAIIATLLFVACSSSEKYGDREKSTAYFYTSDTPKRATAKVLATFSQNGWQVEMNEYYDFDGSTGLVLQKGNHYISFLVYAHGLVKVWVSTHEDNPGDSVRWIVAGKVREAVLNLVKACLD